MTLAAIIKTFTARYWRRRQEAIPEYRALLSATGGLVFVLDGNGRFASYIGGKPTSAGFSPEDFLDKQLTEQVPPEKADAVRQCLDRVFIKGEASVLACQFKIGEKTRHFEVSLVPSGLCKAIAVLRDITHIKRMEDQLRQTQRTEIIGRAAAGLAHDFNNLLMIITGYCNLLQAHIPEHDSSYKQVDEISRAAARAASLTRQLLNCGRTGNSLPARLNMNQVILDTQELLARLAGKHFSINTVLAADLGLVMMNQGELERIIMNLVINARDAMPCGGKITIETSNACLDDSYARIHALAPGNYTVLAVRDTGEGIDEKNMERIFEPFFTTKKHGLGTGLGLSTISSIVNEYQGHVHVESRQGHGAIFKIFLPQLPPSTARSYHIHEMTQVRGTRPAAEDMSSHDVQPGPRFQTGASIPALWMKPAETMAVCPAAIPALEQELVSEKFPPYSQKSFKPTPEQICM